VTFAWLRALFFSTECSAYDADSEEYLYCQLQRMVNHPLTPAFCMLMAYSIMASMERSAQWNRQT
jgi:hypothetical protein